VVLGFGFGIALLIVAANGPAVPLVSRLWFCAAVFLLVLPLIPLPVALVQWISPERVALVQKFPIESASAAPWIQLSLAPGRTVQRLWQLFLIWSCFRISRYAARGSSCDRLLPLGLGTVALILGAIELWARWHSRKTVLGLWAISWDGSAGTFGNRNHFADWIYVASLFGFGWVLRNGWPLQSARPERLPSSARRRFDSCFLILALGFSLVLAVATGSRGGLLAFCAGAATWGWLLVRRSRSKTRWAAIALLLLPLFLLMVSAGGFLFERLAGTDWSLGGRIMKLDIWRLALQIAGRFPFFGAGPGTFVTASNIYKTNWGDRTFLHVENEPLEWLAEMGIIGLAVFGYGLSRAGIRLGQWLLASKLAEPELAIGAAAALVAFLVHSCFEFVFQTPATALLAAALAGFLAGKRDESPGTIAKVPRNLSSGVEREGRRKGEEAGNLDVSRRTVFLNVSAAGTMLILALLQGEAFVRFQTGLRERLLPSNLKTVESAVRIWPFHTSRRLRLVRLEAARFQTEPPQTHPKLANEIRSHLNAGLKLDPFDWELRFERAWFDLLFSSDAVRAVAEARETIRLNPLQAQIPLQFARFFAVRRPDLAWDFLKAAPWENEQRATEILTLACAIKQNAATLWELTPNTPSGLLQLGNFALSKDWFPLAAQAFQLLTNRVEPVMLAEKLLQAQRPDLAESVLPNPPADGKAKLAAAEIALANGDWARAIGFAESIWLESPARDQIVRNQTGSAANELGRARLAVEAIKESPASERDLGRLQQLAQQFPGEWHFRWIIFQTYQELGKPQRAAETSIQLARQLVKGR